MRDAERDGGGRGGGHLPRLMAIFRLLNHRLGLVLVRGSRANVRDHQTRNRPGASPFALEARTAAVCCLSRVLVVRRRPAEDGGGGAPPPAGRAERRHRLDLILLRHIRGMRSSWSSEGRPAYGPARLTVAVRWGPGLTRRCGTRMARPVRPAQDQRSQCRVDLARTSVTARWRTPGPVWSQTPSVLWPFGLEAGSAGRVGKADAVSARVRRSGQFCRRSARQSWEPRPLPRQWPRCESPHQSRWCRQPC
jgi:hypothetical protein